MFLELSAYVIFRLGNFLRNERIWFAILHPHNAEMN